MDCIYFEAHGLYTRARVSHLFWFCSPASEIGAVRLELICFEGGCSLGCCQGALLAPTRHSPGAHLGLSWAAFEVHLRLT